MISVAVVLENGYFKDWFYNGSPFVRGISYWICMIREELERTGIQLVEYDEKSYSYFLHFDRFRKDVIERYPDSTHIYLSVEPQVVEISDSPKWLKKLAHYVFDAIIAVRTDIQDERIYPVVLPVDTRFIGSLEEKPSGLACLLSGDKVGIGKELYSLRRKVIRYAEMNESDKFAFFGLHWGKPYSNYKVYKGHVSDKTELGGAYRYNFCFENEWGCAGYVTEKIFDALTVGMIPVYYGAPDIDKYVPEDCYIDYSKFASIEDCFNYLKGISDDEYIAMKKRICEFMSSPSTHERYSAENMASVIKKIIDKKECHKKRKLYLLDICRWRQYFYRKMCRLKRVTDKLVV